MGENELANTTTNQKKKIPKMTSFKGNSEAAYSKTSQYF